ncbi:type II secretion system protein J [Halobacteriovorax sp.]|uniref:PulJ/GspJ family protein n=1 Tax=Halobacteriovorax sp. TaxID=2020862 RepID=UPI003567FCC2
MKKILNTSKGFTLAEVVVAAGLMGVVLLFSAKFFSNVSKSNNKVSDDLVHTLGKLHLSKFINFDIESSRYSFNTVGILDDNENSFFDYYFDSPCIKNCSRTFTLEIPAQEGGVSRSFYMITSDRNYNKDVIYSPQQAYDDSDLTFISLNNKGFLAKRSFSPWIKGKLLFLYSIVPIRANGANPQEVPPRHISYLGWVNNANSQAELIREEIVDGGNSYFYNTDPRDDMTISSEDEAFRRLPYIRGLGNDMYLTSVKLVRYRLKTERVKGSLVTRLYRGVKRMEAGFHEIAIGEGIKSLKFIRDNVSSGEVRVLLDI